MGFTPEFVVTFEADDLSLLPPGWLLRLSLNSCLLPLSFGDFGTFRRRSWLTDEAFTLSLTLDYRFPLFPFIVISDAYVCGNFSSSSSF